jgi:hypothetical protein
MSDVPWHLPEFMRDFRDQMDVFRAIETWDACNRTSDEQRRYPRPNWVDAHVYTVDVFLGFMAEHGYTLQRCRKNMEFRDIAETVSGDAADRRSASAGAICSIMATKAE